LTGAGSLGVRLGHIGQQLNNINALLGGSLTVDGRATDVSETAVAGVAEIAVDFAAAPHSMPSSTASSPSLPAIRAARAASRPT
jgi:hypothetical protein